MGSESALTHARSSLAFALAMMGFACGKLSQTLVTPPTEAPTAAVLALSELALADGASSGTPTVELYPPFSPDIHDYYVRCGAGRNGFAVSMTASQGADSVLRQPITSASISTQTVSISVDEGGAIVAAATDGAASVEYWVRCLPHDFPALDMRVHSDAAAPGYYLVGNTTALPGKSAYAMVIDGHGVPVWYARGDVGVFNVDSIVDGAVSFISPLSKRSYEVHALSPSATTYVTAAGTPADEHELRALPNGNYLIFQSPTVSPVDLTGLALPTAHGGVQSFGTNGTILECEIDEVDPQGNVVWRWVATDHFDPVKDMMFLTVPLQEASGPVVEPFHCNSIDVGPDGNLLVSARDMDSIFYVERPSGKVLWKLGGATYSKDGATYVPVADPFHRQHDARLQKSWRPSCSGRAGSGEIALFDDETGLKGPARGVVYDLHVEAEGCSAGDVKSSAVVAWQYDGTGPVELTGSFRVLDGGGAIVGWGSTPGFVFTEVDENGNDQVDFYFTDGSVSYRAVKLPLSAFDLDVLRATAGERN